MAFLHHSHGSGDNTASWISRWLKRYAQASLTKYEQLEVHGVEESKVTFSTISNRQEDKMELVFDGESDLSAVDKLSQVITGLLEVIYHLLLSLFVFGYSILIT